MEIALLITLVVTNIFWLWFTFKREDSIKDERRQLLNRIAHPETFVPSVQQEKIAVKETEAAKEFADETKMDLPERFEFAAVGKVDPGLMRSEDDNAS